MIQPRAVIPGRIVRPGVRVRHGEEARQWHREQYAAKLRQRRRELALECLGIIAATVAVAVAVVWWL